MYGGPQAQEVGAKCQLWGALRGAASGVLPVGVRVGGTSAVVAPPPSVAALQGFGVSNVGVLSMVGAMATSNLATTAGVRAGSLVGASMPHNTCSMSKDHGSSQDP